jgi:hypothetical protein
MRLLFSALSASVAPIVAVWPSTKADSVSRLAPTWRKSSSVPPSIMVAIGASLRPTSSVSRAAAAYLSQRSASAPMMSRSTGDRSLRPAMARMRSLVVARSCRVSSLSERSSAALTLLLAHET